MRRLYLILSVIVILAILIAVFIYYCFSRNPVAIVTQNAPTAFNDTTPLPTLTVTNLTNMQLLSQDFQNGNPIPIKFSCKGENISPELSIKDLYPRTVSLALILEDPDAPMGTYYHWVVWNWDSAITESKSGSAPLGAEEGLNSSGEKGYTGPCPPSGTHHYNFKLYALDIQLTLNNKTTAVELAKAMQGHILAQTTLTGLFTH
jgi:Raf kinase inhibitor-like YbhB/YbcL family protein